MNKNLLKEIPLLMIILLPYIIILLFWNSFPDEVPIFWDMLDGTNRLVSKMPGLLMIPSLNLFIYLLFLAVPRIDRRWKDFTLFNSSFYWLRLGVTIFMGIVWLVTIVTVD
jgi:uncharacterized membrane protein